ncbi:prolipoprotein diacylglyceryl transferase [Kingella negevensis]|uniref:prolipoprotein diacylglyceryl transferase n=1 Tax=Kingella negevensis TaxID=1522312 RepID=UPI00050A2A6A|nr:prolipoprotein diacylglyceryl transferase [Kingella negevensis]MDK4679813.1 prolipoprotein diacylglyceryl transferase [Kingella negevensis]MDK4682468.1 prolipoprotein diacylglyceryl transferase [Kingella negevensis]MDK4688846.1 prolipoprotein diacylglyceryl transferase [Kingella negevensis]MDK4690665.1 prolipoprotein diacylglyceryl transferase [Kingella negevensis]MDK4694188.1 prolipoprotein diacylglyceryl transferase [Kingella negevensis]
MIIHPQFNPVALQLGPLAIRWYALSYIVGFMLFIWLGRKRIKAGNSPFTVEMLDDLLTWGVVGVILGGRIGYILFYNLDQYLANPISMLKVWEGGMSFHGGFLGVVCAIFLFAKKHGLRFWQALDFVAPLVPTGLASGRIGNFINGELWGRVTNPNNFWAMGFPQAHEADQALAASNPQYLEWFNQFGMLPRHPSQLYQFALEGLSLFAIVWLFSKKSRPEGQVSMVFLGGYGIFRFIAEYARQPDAQLGELALGMSMGQWLSLPMIVLGVIGFIYFGKRSLKK